MSFDPFGLYRGGHLEYEGGKLVPKVDDLAPIDKKCGVGKCVLKQKHKRGQSGDGYQQGPYRLPPFGNNSNTAADNIIEGAGGIVPNVPGAWGQNYGER